LDQAGSKKEQVAGTFECCLTNHISAESWESIVCTAVMMCVQSYLAEFPWHITVALSRQPKLQSCKHKPWIEATKWCTDWMFASERWGKLKNQETV